MSDAGVEEISLSLKKADMANDVEKMEADCTDHKVTTDAADSSKSNGLPASGAGDNKQSVDVKTKTEQKTVEDSKCKTNKTAEEKESADDNAEPTKSPTKRKSKAVEKEADSSPKKKSKKETTVVPDEDVNKSAKTSKADDKEEVKEEKKNPKQKSDKKKEESSDDEDEGSEEDDDDDEKAETKQPGLLERPVILEEGCKREKKKVQRLEVTPVHNERKSLSIVDGSGTKLGDIPRIELQLQKFHSEDLKPLHRFLFDRVEKTTMVKRNVRLFSGFTFSKSSTEFTKKKDRLAKFTSPLLKMVCEVLDLERKGKKEEIIDRIMDFLIKPESSGKPLPKPSQKRRRSSSAKKSSPKSKKDGEKKPRKKKEKKDAEAGGGDDSGSESEKEADAEDKDEKASEKSESEKEAASSDDDEPKKKKKKSTPAKKATKPKAAKKTPKSESKKPAKKTAGKKKAKAESSSGDSSDDDEPLEKKKKGPPTDSMLKDVIKKILKTANLEEVTMKTVCKQVYDKYPEFDLTARKDFIKATVKQILK